MSFTTQNSITRLPYTYESYIFCSLYLELVQILSVVLGDIQPIHLQRGYKPDLIVADYTDLLDKWKEIYRKEPYYDLDIMKFTGFDDLEDEFQQTVELWNELKTEFADTVHSFRLGSFEPSTYILPHELRAQFETVESTLRKYHDQKEYMASLTTFDEVYIFYHIIFDYSRGVYFYQKQEKEFQPGIDEFRFLKMLLDNRNRIVTYEELNTVLNKKVPTTVDLKALIQDTRKNLKKQFIQLHINPEHTDYMMEKIISKTNLGYILH